MTKRKSLMRKNWMKMTNSMVSFIFMQCYNLLEFDLDEEEEDDDLADEEEEVVFEDEPEAAAPEEEAVEEEPAAEASEDAKEDL